MIFDSTVENLSFLDCILTSTSDIKTDLHVVFRKLLLLDNSCETYEFIVCDQQGRRKGGTLQGPCLLKGGQRGNRCPYITAS